MTEQIDETEEQLMARIDRVMLMVRAELASATLKFGSFASAHEGYAVILEEVDELWDEVKNDKMPGANERRRREAMQIAAMGARFLLDIDAGPRPSPPRSWREQLRHDNAVEDSTGYYDPAGAQ